MSPASPSGDVVPINRAEQRRPIVVIMGMHRSGTSLCSHVLSMLGVDMADELVVHPNNAKGHWERLEIVNAHDRILQHLNRAYHGPFHDYGLPPAWWADPSVAQVKREIIAFLEGRMRGGYFGFKDPRTVRLMPMWHEIFGELKLAPKIVLCLRNPMQVARSLQQRDGLDLDRGEYRWFVHMVDFFRYVADLDFCTIEYETWFDDRTKNVEILTDFLGLKWPLRRDDLELAVGELISPALRHDAPGLSDAVRPQVRALYDLASRAAGDIEVRAKIDSLVSYFASFEQLQMPLYKAVEHVTEIAAKVPSLEVRAGQLEMVREQFRHADEGRAQAERFAQEIERERASLAEKIGQLHGELATAYEQRHQAEEGGRQADRLAQSRAVELEQCQTLLAAQADRAATTEGKLTASLAQLQSEQQLRITRELELRSEHELRMRRELELRAIETSTAWRATLPMRRVLAAMPRLRRGLRGVAGLASRCYRAMRTKL